MHKTQHATHRMSQRGISGAMVEFALEWGINDGDKYVLGKKEAIARLEQLKQEERTLKRVIDKGGLIVVADGEHVITTYNWNA